LTPHYKEYLERRVEDRGFSKNFCGKFATHEVDGVHLCAQHAGQLALEFMEQPKTKIVLVQN